MLQVFPRGLHSWREQLYNCCIGGRRDTIVKYYIDIDFDIDIDIVIQVFPAGWWFSSRYWFVNTICQHNEERQDVTQCGGYRNADGSLCDGTLCNATPQCSTVLGHCVMHGTASVMGCVMVQLVTWGCVMVPLVTGGCVMVQPVTWGVCHGTASNIGVCHGTASDMGGEYITCG